MGPQQRGAAFLLKWRRAPVGRAVGQRGLGNDFRGILVELAAGRGCADEAAPAQAAAASANGQGGRRPAPRVELVGHGEAASSGLPAHRGRAIRRRPAAHGAQGLEWARAHLTNDEVRSYGTIQLYCTLHEVVIFACLALRSNVLQGPAESTCSTLCR